jgi:hypothetical protein
VKKLLVIRLTVVGALASFLLASCLSEPEPLRPQDSALKSARRDDSFVIVRFMDETMLKSRYGYKFNPFIAITHVMTPIRFMVFKLNIEEVKRPLFLKLDQMRFTLGGILGGPMNRQALASYWQTEDESSGITSLERTDRDRYLREETMVDQILIPAGGRYSCLIVFFANYPLGGEAKLSLPLFDENKKLVDKVEFTYEF